MPPSPSDEWLLALLDEKSPEELTPAELAAIRERAHVSPAVRAAIAEHVRLEAALHARFGEPAVTAESVLRRAAGRRGRLAGLGLFALLLAAGTGATLWFLSRPDGPRANDPTRPAVAARKTEEPRRDELTPPITATPAATPVEAVRPNPAPTPATVAAAEPAPPQQPPAVTPPAGPWTAALADDARVVPFEESAFAFFGETPPGFEVADELPATLLTPWLTAVPNRPFNVNEGQWRGKRFAGLEGTGRLLAPWRPDAVLRLATFDIGEFSLHVWNGDKGHLIRFYPHFRPQLVAAYAVTREGADPTPKSFRLVATDGGAYSRANAGAIELRHQDGRLVVTRGAVPLLVLPSPDPPAEVLLDGRTRVRSLTMYRGEPAPLPPPAPRRELLAVSPPPPRKGQGGGERPNNADPARPHLPENWLTSTDPPAHLATADGKVTLSLPGGDKGPRKAAWAAVRVPEATGLAEVVFRLADLTPGTGLYLGDADGKPIHALFASENTPAAGPMLHYGWTSRDGSVPEPRWRWDTDPKHELASTAGPGTWVKLVVGPGGLKTFFSGDGERWGPAARSPERAVRGAFASVGLFAMADDKPRSVSLSSVSVRELSGLAGAADPALRKRVPAFEGDPSARPADWLTWVMATRPGDVPQAAWLRACGVESLARGVPDPVAAAILDGLARDAIDSGRPTVAVVELLHDVALLSDLWDDRARRFAEYYDSLARRIAERGGDPASVAADLVAVAEGYVAAPIWTEARPWALPPSVVRNLAATAAWSPAASSASRRVAAYLAPGHPESGWSMEDDAGLARVAVWASQRGSASRGSFDGSARFGWQHPLATEPGREGGTVAAELEAALAAGAYDDAARLTATLAGLTGLVPATNDPDRFLPPAGLVAEAAARHPELVKTLSERFGPAGMIRVREAAAIGDEVALHEAAVRFFGTPAASEAHRRLGESALADGRFGEASSHFSAALTVAPEHDRGDLSARLRLAASLSGEDAAAPATGPVTFGDRSLDAAAFERMVSGLRQARASTASVTAAPVVSIPEPVAIKPESRGRFEGDVGRNPGRGEFRRFDWAGRQIGVTVAGGVAYLSNRFQVAAFDLGRRAPNWAVGLGGEQGEAHSLPGVAFKPLVQGDRLYVRRLVGRTPELTCLATAEGGKILWRSEAELAMASDPLPHDGALVAAAYSVDGRPGGPFTLSLVRLRPEDGAVTASAPLLTVSGAGEEKPYALLTRVEDGFLVTTWGAAARCDADGSLLWVRKLSHLPAAADPDADRLAPDPPVLDGDHVLVASPGSRAVVCLEASTGRLLWTRPLGELERLIGRAGPVTVVKSGESLLGLDPATGGTTWAFRRAGLLEGVLRDDDTVLAAARVELENNQDALSLLRLDAAAGRLRSEQVVRVKREEEVRLGPLFVHEGTVWALVGEHWRDPKRTLVEFAPDPAAPPVGPPADAGPLADWVAHVEPATAPNVASVMPGWTAIAAQTGNPKKGAELRDEARGERSVLETESNRDRAATFVRTFEVPTGPSKLVARVGREDDSGWTLRVLADGKPFASEPVDVKSAPDGWRTVTFDLSPLAGKAVTLALDQAPPADKPDKGTKAFWKSVRIE